MTDRYQDRLSEFLDGELSGEDTARVEAHLGRCDECRDTLAGLRAVRARAGALPDRAAPGDLWSGIVARLDRDEDSITGDEPRPEARGRLVVSARQLAAAAVALMALSAGAAWHLADTAAERTARTNDVPAVGGATLTGVTGEPESPEIGSYTRAIAELEAALFDPDAALPPQTVERVRKSLEVIDRAIGDARRALAESPDDSYVRQHLGAKLRQKADFLRQAARLAQT